MSRVLFFLPNISGYQDRVRLLMEVSREIDLILLVGRHDLRLDASGYDRFHVMDAGFRPGWRIWNMRKASGIVEQLILAGSVSVVNDTFGTLLPLYKRKDRYPEVWFLTSLYIIASWRLRHNMGHLGLFHLLRHNRRMLINQWVERRICLASDVIVVQAPGLIERVIENVPIPKDHVATLPNNVNTEFWDACDQHAQCPSNHRGLRLLYVGGIDHSKGIFALIEAMRLLKQSAHDCRLRIVGAWGTRRIGGKRGPLSKEHALNEIARHGLQDDIEFTPRTSREKLREIYRDSDLFIYQTTNDGTPRVVLEALACGLPVIASHHPGIDAIDPDQEFIAFTEFGDARQIAHFIKAYQSQPQQWGYRSQKGRLAVVERFSTPNVASQYRDFYRSLTAGRAKP